MRMCATCTWGPQRSEEDMRAPRTGVNMCVLETEPGLSAGAANALNCWPMSPVPVSPVCLVTVCAHCFFTSALPYNDQNKTPHCPGAQEASVWPVPKPPQLIYLPSGRAISMFLLLFWWRLRAGEPLCCEQRLWLG